MFEHPDADYLQDLLAGYVLGHLDPVELHYLQQQVSQDPQLQRVLHQLEYALGSLTDHLPVTPITAPLIPSSIAYLPVVSGAHVPITRRTARRIVIGSGLAAAIAIAVGLPWLLSRSRFSDLLADRFSTPSDTVETLNALQVWHGLQTLIDHHANAAAHADHAGIDLDSEEAEQILTTLHNYMPDVDQMIVLEHPLAQLIGGSHYEQPHLQGICFTYQLNHKILVSVYQLRLGISHTLEFPPQTNLYIDTGVGTNLVLWRQGSILYGIVADLSISELQQLRRMTNTH
jgi:hypothetical protein